MKENKMMFSWKSEGQHYSTLSPTCEKWLQIEVSSSSGGFRCRVNKSVPTGCLLKG